jgi:hypothetical protein
MTKGPFGDRGCSGCIDDESTKASSVWFANVFIFDFLKKCKILSSCKVDFAAENLAAPNEVNVDHVGSFCICKYKAVIAMVTNTNITTNRRLLIFLLNVKGSSLLPSIQLDIMYRTYPVTFLEHRFPSKTKTDQSPRVHITSKHEQSSKSLINDLSHLFLFVQKPGSHVLDKNPMEAQKITKHHIKQ